VGETGRQKVAQLRVADVALVGDLSGQVDRSPPSPAPEVVTADVPGSEQDDLLVVIEVSPRTHVAEEGEESFLDQFVRVRVLKIEKDAPDAVHEPGQVVGKHGHSPLRGREIGAGNRFAVVSPLSLG